MATKETYRVRKDWGDPKSQLGAYSILNNAIKTCEKGGSEYKVYNSKGEVVYPKEEKEEVKIDVSKVNTAAADPKKMWDYFKSKGLSDCGVAGLMGNLYAESGLKSCNLQGSYETKLGMNDAEYTAAVDAGTYTNFVKDSAGYGLAQWTYWSLKQDLYNYMKKLNKSIGDLEGQMEFLAYQLEKDYNAVWKTLKNAKTVLEASNAVLLKFERPADQSEAAQNKRASYGQKYYDSYAKKTNVIEPVKKPTTSTIEIPKEGVNGNMKYSSNNKPLCCIMTQSTCYKGTHIMDVKGVLWHSTGANNPTLKRYVQPDDNAKDKDTWIKLLGKNNNKNDMNHIQREMGVNAWIGELANGTVTTVQVLPWNYFPWGCASGPKGSCNNGWIQFEICEDNLSDEKYFNAIYKEACELTAYLCNLYNLDPNGTVNYNGVKVPVILCHADSYDLGLGSNHGDVYHWFEKYGKTMENVRADVAKLMGKTPVKAEKEEKILYRIRKTWEDTKSQIGAYTDLENAKEACDKAGKDYEVYNNKGTAIYPTPAAEPEEENDEEAKEVVSKYKVGQNIKIKKGSKYIDGNIIPTWVLNATLYVRSIRSNGDIIFSTKKTGAVTGVVKESCIIDPNKKVTSIEQTETPSNSDFKPYLIKVNTDVLNVRTGPGTNYKIVTQVTFANLYTIIEEKNNWGKLKSGAGWICLDYAKRLKYV